MFEYKPDNIFAGTFPVATEIATAAVDIVKLTPVTLSDGKISPATSSTLANIVGIAAEDATANTETVYYATGEFQMQSIVLPESVTIDDIKPILAKINIYIV